MALDPLHRDRQLKAIDIALATAPKIQDDFKEKFGYGENKFFYLDLVEYRINNSLPKIAEDLDVKSLYGLTTDEVARSSVGLAFRGHHNEDFMPEYQFNGLFGKVTNDYIEGIWKDKAYANGLGNLTSKELSEHGRKGGLIGMRKLASMINPETGERYLVEAGRKGGRIADSRGTGFWQTHPALLEDIVKFREESIGKGHHTKKKLPSMDYVTAKMNEKYGEDWTTGQVSKAYHNNKHLLPDEEE